MPVSGGTHFETLVLPHLDAAYNLARWLLRDEAAAEDAVQEASLRAFRYFDSLRGEDARPWLLGIVRNTCFTLLERQRNGPERIEFDDEQFDAALCAAEHDSADPSRRLQRRHTCEQIDAALQALSPALREVIVLREFEEIGRAHV